MDLLGGVYVGTLANNGVRIAPYHDLSSSVSNGLNNEIKKLRSSIINGFLLCKELNQQVIWDINNLRSL